MWNSEQALPPRILATSNATYIPVNSQAQMRLLKLEENGEISLTKDITYPITPYAILSHTWGEDDQEVNFEDLKNGSGKTKDGYRKLQFCGEQATRDGLQYFWVDTCCIDKSSSTELSEAINSMFQWYKGADVCYAYLVDVSMSSSTASFGDSRWFTRGWTLQELLAPRVVRFYSIDWVEIGTKATLSDQIADFTGIPISVLRGKDFADCSLAERMSWASKRSTTRTEDTAYCLMGLFNINMTLLYGEGGPKAFIRLQKKIMMTLKEDHTLFAWRSHRPKAEGLLTDSPADFCLKNCNTCLQDREFEYSSLLRTYHVTGCMRDPPSLTSHGLCINLGLEKQTASPSSGVGGVLASLNLSIHHPDEPERDEMLCVFLEPHQYMPGKYFRRNSQIRLNKLSNWGSCKIYVHQEIPRVSVTTP
jgi:hypothetical protein